MKTIPAAQVIERLRVENPWWAAPHRIADRFADLKRRAYFRLLFPLVARSPVRRAVLLMGPRRVGKTVLIHHVIQQLLTDGVSPQRICYVSVDHPIYNECGLEDFLNRVQEATALDPRDGETFVFFDEIQYLRDWEIHLKALVDSYPNLRIVASGSAAAALRLKSVESGAGRFTDFLLPPLTFFEYLELLGLGGLISEDAGPFARSADLGALNAEFVKYLNFGGYPEVAFSSAIQADPGRYIKSDIVEKVLLRDLPSLYGIQDIQELNYLFTTLAYNTAGEVSLDALSKNSGVAKNTIKRYIEYLEAAFLIKIVHRVDRSGKRFQRARQFKVYLSNPSIRAALFSPLGPDGDGIGGLVETGVLSQWFHSPSPLFYARWARGEVDMVQVTPGMGVEWATEVKWSDRAATSPVELDPLVDFCRRNNLGSAIVTSRTVERSVEIQGVSVDFVPAALYCYTIGRNVIDGKITMATRA